MHDSDDAEHAAHLAKRTALAEGIHAMATKPVLHGDNGATLKSTTVLAMLNWLGVNPSYSRPRVIRYVSPAQRHAGADRAILQQRHELYLPGP